MAKKSFKLDFRDIRNFEKKLKAEVKDSKKEVQEGLLQAVTFVHGKSIANTRAGVRYTDGVYESGNLRRSLSFDVAERSGTVFISKGLKYPAFVEFGTKRMRPKPFLTVAVSDNIEKIQEIFRKVQTRILRRLQ